MSLGLPLSLPCDGFRGGHAE